MLQTFFKTVAGIQLPVWIYPPQIENTYSDTLVLCIHGGGWYAMDKNEAWNGGWMDYQARYYAEKGFYGAVISYRSIGLTEQTTVFDLLEDCRDALDFIAEHVPYKRLILMGDSAGGHLAAMLTLQAPDLADVAVLCNPVTDCTADRWAYVARPEQTRQASPIYCVQKTKTRYLLLHGDADTVVDWADTKKFYEKMRENGNICMFHLLPGAKHAFILKGYVSADSQLAEYMNIIDDYINLNL